LTRQNKNLFIGIAIGTIVPILSSLVLKYVLGNFARFSFFKVVSWNDIFLSNDLISTFIQFGVLVNLIVFFILKLKKWYQIQTGVVLPTMIYIFMAMLLKFFF